MGKSPRAEKLPRSEDEYDAARVEEAFASFADRVRELESIAEELRDELRSLRSERAGSRPPTPPAAPVDWPTAGPPRVGPAPDWVSSVPAPIVRPLTIPRAALEGAFLLLVALFAGLADLSATSIVLVMAGAWALVAVSEWAAAAKRTRWRLEQIAPPLLEPEADESTGPWNMPVVEATAVALPDSSESHTVVATLPQESVDVEPAIATEPRRRLRLLRRRKPEPAADPWEA